MDVVTQIVRKEGILGLYAGMESTFWRYVRSRGLSVWVDDVPLPDTFGGTAGTLGVYSKYGRCYPRRM